MCAYAQQGHVFGRVSLNNRLFSALLLEFLQLGVFFYFLTEFNNLQHGLFCLASCNGTIHAFPNKAPLHLKHFLLSFNGTPHPLG